MNFKKTILVTILIIIVGAIVYIESKKPEQSNVGENAVILDQSERVIKKSKKYEPAKEISTPDGFINTPPITVSELIGKKVILVDFWTYSCINCQRTTPYLNAWYDKYADEGLVILGIHTPEFDFEKDYENVLAATEKFNIKYPVILDNDYSTWRSYENRYWPRKYLIDIDGFIVYDHIGEGSYEETEKKIVELLNERKRVLGEEETVSVGEPLVETNSSFSGQVTPEIYFGQKRVEHLFNLPKQECLNMTCEYSIDKVVSLDKYALRGSWKTSPEYTELVSSNGSVTLNFRAQTVNIVAGSEIPVTAEIYLDGKIINSTYEGSDVSGGKVIVTNPNLYNLVKLKETENHTLEIRFNKPGVQAFTFTFG